MYNKYYLTEQMKDCILDAIECLKAIDEIKGDKAYREG